MRSPGGAALRDWGPPMPTSLDLDLIRKYAVPGPRYTSYPPATRFTEDLGAADLERALTDDNGPAAGPLSLYFHLPFCETQCWYCGCNTVITLRRQSAADYLDVLAREVGQMAARLDRRRPVTQIHFGGGTPTFLPPDQLRRLGALIREHFTLATDCEYSVEIDPRRLTEDHIRALAEVGANRASVGVQDTDPRVQLAIHRLQPQSVNEQAFRWLRAHDFKSINVDLIYGLPLQTPDSFARTIDDVLTLAPDRLSVFAYAHVPWIKPAQRIFDHRQQLPGPESRLAMFALAHERLTAAGYVDIGLDHFARPDDALAVAQRAGTLHRNFQGYSTQAGASLYGFGISSISSTPDTFRQNHKTIDDWSSAIERGELPIERALRLTDDDQRRRTVIMRLMCDRRLDFPGLSRAIGASFETAFAAELAGLDDLVADGILTRTHDGFAVTPAGIPLLRVIAMRFDSSVPTPTIRRHAQAI